MEKNDIYQELVRLAGELADGDDPKRKEKYEEFTEKIDSIQEGINELFFVESKYLEDDVEHIRHLLKTLSTFVSSWDRSEQTSTAQDLERASKMLDAELEKRKKVIKEFLDGIEQKAKDLGEALDKL